MNGGPIQKWFLLELEHALYGKEKLDVWMKNMIKTNIEQIKVAE